MFAVIHSALLKTIWKMSRCDSNYQETCMHWSKTYMKLTKFWESKKVLVLSYYSSRNYSASLLIASVNCIPIEAETAVAVYMKILQPVMISDETVKSWSIKNFKFTAMENCYLQFKARNWLRFNSPAIITLLLYNDVLAYLGMSKLHQDMVILYTLSHSMQTTTMMHSKALL